MYLVLSPYISGWSPFPSLSLVILYLLVSSCSLLSSLVLVLVPFLVMMSSSLYISSVIRDWTLQSDIN